MSRTVPRNVGSKYSRIQDYTFSSAGTYYLGVSGYSNYSYNPDVTGSGTLAYDIGDYRLDVDLFVPTADAAGDTLATAQATGLGPRPGTFGVDAPIGDGLYLKNDVDLYRIDVNAGQVVTAVTSLPPGGASMYTVLRAFDSAGNELARNAFGNGNYARIEYQFANAGTYYFGVSGYNNYSYDPTVGNSGFGSNNLGDYHLDLTLTTPVADPAGDTIATALATNLGPSPGTFTATASIGDGLYPTRDVDLYRVDASAGQVLTAATSLPAGGVPFYSMLRLFNASGGQVASYYYGSNSTARVDYQFATAGTYYVGVSGNTSYDPNVGGSGYAGYTGDYQLDLTLVTPTADAAGDSLATALDTNLGPGDGSFSAVGEIGDGLYPLRDVDLYRFDAGEGQVLTATSSLPSGVLKPTVLRLFNATGTQLASYLSYSSAHIEYQFGSAGTYYIGVSAQSGYDPNVPGSGYLAIGSDYQLDLALATPIPDPAPDTLAAVLGTTLGPANGSVGIDSHIGDGLYPLRDVDLYRIDATAGQGLIAATAQVGGTYVLTTLRLFESAGQQLAFNSLGDYPNSAFRHVFATSGTYYVGVSGNGNNSYDPTTAGYGSPLGTWGDYHLDLSLVAPNLDSVGDSINTALDTGLGPAAGTYTMPSSTIGDGFWASRDVDMYRFTATAGQKLSASITAVAGSTPLTYGVLRLFDSAGHLLTTGYTYSSIQNYTFASSDTFYLGVSGYSNWSYDPNVPGSGNVASYTGDYSLTMTLVTPIPDAEPDRIGDVLTASLGPTAGTYGNTAQIGDGLYPARDVDLYRVDVSAGQLLRIRTSQPAGGTLLSPVLRVFDSAGNELAATYSSYDANVSLDYQFSTAGTYYVGVSGYYNRYYNPNVANSGYTGQQIGDYHIDLTLITPTPDAEGETIATAVATGLVLALRKGSSAPALDLLSLPRSPV